MPSLENEKKKGIGRRGTRRVLRGGSNWNEPQNCAVAIRNNNDPENRDNNNGFRLLLQLAAPGRSRTKQADVLLSNE